MLVGAAGWVVLLVLAVRIASICGLPGVSSMALAAGQGDFTAAPPSVPVIPNEAVVRGEVAGWGFVDSGALGIQPARTLWVLVLRLESIENVPGCRNLLSGREGQVIVVLTSQEVSSELYGRAVQAHVWLAGDERQRRWWAGGIGPAPAAD